MSVDSIRVNDSDSRESMNDENSSDASRGAISFEEIFEYPNIQLFLTACSKSRWMLPMDNLLRFLSTSLRVVQHSQETMKSEDVAAFLPDSELSTARIYLRQILSDTVIHKLFHDTQLQRLQRNVLVQIFMSLKLILKIFVHALSLRATDLMEKVQTQAEGEERNELEEDVYILASWTIQALERKGSEFSRVVRTMRVPSVQEMKQQEMINGLVDLGLDLDDDEDAENDKDQISAQQVPQFNKQEQVSGNHSWIWALLIQFTEDEGWRRLAQVAMLPSVGLLLRSQLTYLVQVGGEMLKRYAPSETDIFSSMCSNQLQYLSLIVSGWEQFTSSDGEIRNPGGLYQSQVEQATDLLSCVFSILQTMELNGSFKDIVNIYQRLVLLLLNQSNFMFNLLGVKELGQLLVCAQKSQMTRHEFVSLSQWIEQEDVVMRIIRGDLLHQKQYTEQVIRVLQVLAELELLRNKYIQALWTCAVGGGDAVHESVRSYIYWVMVQLLPRITEAQQDLILKLLADQFSSCTSDQLKILDLLFQVATGASNNNSSLCGKCLDALFDLIAKVREGGSRMDALAGRFVDVLTSIDPLGVGVLREYEAKALELIEMESCLVMACSILTSVLCQRNTKGGVQQGWLQFLNKISISLEQYVQKGLEYARTHLNVPLEHIPGDEQSSFQNVYFHFVILLTTIIKTRDSSHIHAKGQQLSWDMICKLWDVLIERLNVGQMTRLRQRGVDVFLTSLECNLLDKDTIHKLLEEKVAQLCRGGSQVGGSIADLLLKLFIQCNILEGNILSLQIGQNKWCVIACEEKLVGMWIVWDAIMMTSDTDAKRTLMNQLISLYSDMVRFPRNAKPYVMQSFLQFCCTQLFECAKWLVDYEGESGKHGPDPKFMVQWSQGVQLPDKGLKWYDDKGSMAFYAKTSGVLELILLLLQKGQSQILLSRRSHALCVPGDPIIVNLKSQSVDLTSPIIYTHDATCLGDIRQIINERSKSPQKPAEYIKMYLCGQDRSDDLQQLKTFAFVEGDSMPSIGLHIIYGLTSNTAIDPNSEVKKAIESVQPSILLSRMSDLYQALFFLADLPGNPGSTTAEFYQDVQQKALDILDLLPTWEQMQESALKAIRGTKPVHDIRALFVGAQDQIKPTRLLYLLQISLAWVYKDREQGGNHYKHFLQCRPVIQTLFAAVINSWNSPAATGKHGNYWQEMSLVSLRLLEQLYSTIQEQQQQLQSQNTSMNAPSESPDRDNEDSAMSVDSANQTSVMSVDVDNSGRANESDGTDLTALVVSFCVSLASQASTTAQTWNVVPDFESTCRDESSLPPVRVIIRSLGLVQKIHQLGDKQKILNLFLQSPTVKQMFRKIIFQRDLRSLRKWFVKYIWNMCCEGNIEDDVDDRYQQLNLPTGMDDVEAIEQQKNDQGYMWLLKLLKEVLEEADHHVGSCEEFFELFCQLLKSRKLQHTSQVFEIMKEIGNRQVEKILLTQAPQDEFDERLECHLRLLQTLVHFGEVEVVTDMQTIELIDFLFWKALFPETKLRNFLAHGDKHANQQLYTEAESIGALAWTPGSRHAGLDVLGELCARNSSCFLHGTDLLMQHHLVPVSQIKHVFNIQSVFNTSPQPYVGLHNAGATCYMNCLLQQLFMQPSIRALILGAQEILDQQERRDSWFANLQMLFAQMALLNETSVRPDGFWGAYRDLDGCQLDANRHEDAEEFLRRLQDAIDGHLTSSKQLAAVGSVMGGTFVQQIRCVDVDYVSEVKEDFYTVTLEVHGRRDINESLQLFIRGELLEGENAYYCEKVGRKVDAVKRTLFKQLPHTLVFNLKRFEYDAFGGMAEKINDMFIFNHHLDMYPFTAEAQEEEIIGDRKRYLYELKGVVVHQGDAHSGHYYSFIKEREKWDQEGQIVPGRWFRFDDQTVTPWDESQLGPDCFGGETPLPNCGSRRNPTAYILVFERSPELEPIRNIEDIKSKWNQLHPSDMLYGSQLDFNSSTHIIPKKPRDLCHRIQLNIPRQIFRNVMLQNIQMQYYCHIFQPQFCDMILRCVVEFSLSGSRKVARRKAPSPSNSKNGGSSKDDKNSSPSREQGEAQKRAMDMLLLCFAKIYTRLVDDIPGSSFASMDQMIVGSQKMLEQWRMAILRVLEGFREDQELLISVINRHFSFHQNSDKVNLITETEKQRTIEHTTWLYWLLYGHPSYGVRKLVADLTSRVFMFVENLPIRWQQLGLRNAHDIMIRCDVGDPSAAVYWMVKSLVAGGDAHCRYRQSRQIQQLEDVDFYMTAAIGPILKYLNMGPNQRAHMCHVMALDLLLIPFKSRIFSEINCTDDELFMSQLFTAWSLLIRSCKNESGGIDESNPHLDVEGMSDPMEISIPFWKHQRQIVKSLIDNDPRLLLNGQPTLDLIKFYQYNNESFTYATLQAMWKLVQISNDNASLQQAIIELIVKVGDQLSEIRIQNFVQSDLKDMDVGLVPVLVHHQSFMKQMAPVSVLERQFQIMGCILMIHKECDTNCGRVLVSKMKRYPHFLDWWQSFKDKLESRFEGMREDVRERAMDLISSGDEMLNSVNDQ